jgi:hypothetical protein
MCARPSASSATTSNRQEPFVYGSLGGDDVALVPAPATAATPAPQAAPSSQADARRDYELATQVGSKAALEAFLAQYPDGFYASLARSQLDKLAAATPAAPARPQPSAPGQAAKGLDKPADTPAAPAATEKSVNVAALNAGSPQADLTRSVQAELRRVGCLTSDADDTWNSAAQRSLSQFNRYAGTKFDTKTASADALDAIKQKSSRVCPLVCEHGYKADGNQCTRIVCAEGSFLNDDNECEKRHEKKPVATRDRPDSRQSIVRRSQAPTSALGPGTTPTGRPLTGSERMLGCNSNEAIMSGRCP